ncbi:hypothetical protein LDENG_00114550 [Lucifuga dentata]|nr:hypothetical protein LDENG_00114550 [Lucifuga dentata]
MYYQDQEELEDVLYGEEENSDGSEAESELEFHLYSQLHYSSNLGEMEEQEDRGEEEDKGKDRDSQQLVTEGEHTGESKPPSPNTSQLQQQLKGLKKVEQKGKKLNKQKNCKHDPKAKRSSLFQEVIVIDSSTDVISISDDDSDENDEGVCVLKGQSSRQLKASTCSQQATEKRKRSLSTELTVDSSSSDSDELETSKFKEESDSSDSDGLENWMILGRGKQYGDQSISLNLEGGSNSNSDVGEDEEKAWLVSDKDKDAQICNKDRGARMVVQQLSNRYYTSKNVHCRNCSKTGHLSKNCPEPKKVSSCFLCGTPGHLVVECPNKHCNNCGQPGHLFESCTERAYWRKQCHRCGMTGHFFDACPEIWRQYHITTKVGPPVRLEAEDLGRTPAYCYNCSRKGHFGHACTKQRMFNGMYPSIPFINHYDTMQDIKRRQHRIKFKVKDLKENGIFPKSHEACLTPGPPKKKQKTNHQPNHNSHQTPNHHKSGSGHIIFRDDMDCITTTPKANKANWHKQQQSSSVKQWKPKRPVPTSRHQPPTGKLVMDEADDFPRGGNNGRNTHKNKKGKLKNKYIPPKPQEKVRDSSRQRPVWTAKGPMRDLVPELKRKKKKQNQKKAAAEMYPKDENLFIIKQRRPKS